MQIVKAPMNLVMGKPYTAPSTAGSVRLRMELGAVVSRNKSFIAQYVEEIKRIMAKHELKRTSACNEELGGCYARYNSRIAPDGMPNCIRRRDDLFIRWMAAEKESRARNQNLVLDSSRPVTTFKTAVAWGTEYADPAYWTDPKSQDAARNMVRPYLDRMQSMGSDHAALMRKLGSGRG